MRQHYLSTCLLAFFGLLLFASCSSQRVASSKPAKKPAVAKSHRPAATAPSEKAAKTVRAAKTDKAEIVITNARAYLGTPYRYGGTDRKGIDCSGLLLCSFREADISLPRTSAEQSSYGNPATWFFSQPKSGRAKFLMPAW
jgi:cell wall-associated NlpC family hydrolase